MNPPEWATLPFIIPGLGDLLDMMDIQLSIGPEVRWFRSFVKSLMEQHDGNAGRDKNFLIIFMLILRPKLNGQLLDTYDRQ